VSSADSAAAPDLHEALFAQALAEARKGEGRTRPNPPVGAVIVRDGVVVGRGHHRAAGLPHAEVEAIRDAGEAALGADMYVTLEPHDHHGRTPPCTLAIIAAGIRRVFCGVEDPNPLVAGRGFATLRRHGVEVRTGLGGGEAAELIRPFARLIASGRPHVVLKAAASLDGKLATASGDSRWVSGPAARALVHAWRDSCDAVLVGAGTVRADDPQLTTRLEGPAVEGRTPRHPLRVVLSGRLDLPVDAALWDLSTAPTLVYASERGVASSPELAARLRDRGVEMVVLPGDASGRIAPTELLADLGRRGLCSLLVEGGAQLHAALWQAGVADELRLFLAPSIVGGDGISWLGPLGLERMYDAPRLKVVERRVVGDDLLLRALRG